MTSNSIVPEATARSELLLRAGANPAAPLTRLDPGWEEHAAAFLVAHPEISAALPGWTEELTFSEIEDEYEETVFSYSRTIRDVEIYGVGCLHSDGRIDLHDNGVPNIYITSELRADLRSEVAEWAAEVAEDLIAAARLLRAEPKLLRRPAEVDDNLQRLDI